MLKYIWNNLFPKNTGMKDEVNSSLQMPDMEEGTAGISEHEKQEEHEKKEEREKQKKYEKIELSEVDILEVLRDRLPEIDFKAGLTFCCEDEAFYLELFQDFTKLPIKEELIRYWNEEDYKNYCIRIHGFKNNAYSLGATALGDLAYEMELLSKEGLPEELEVMQIRLAEQYDRICQTYCEITKAGTAVGNADETR